MSRIQPMINLGFFVPVTIPSVHPCVMHRFFTAHFDLLNESTSIQLISLLGFTTGYLLFCDVQQYALSEGYGLSAESQEAVNIATTLWDVLSEAERQEWHDLATNLTPIYVERNRMSTVPLISMMQRLWLHAELGNIWTRLFGSRRAYQTMMNEPLQFVDNSHQELASTPSNPSSGTPAAPHLLHMIWACDLK